VREASGCGRLVGVVYSMGHQKCLLLHKTFKVQLSVYISDVVAWKHSDDAS
jgi:hypothetical protein